MRAVQHQAVVTDRPARSTGHLLADEAVFSGQQVIGERVLIEDVAELAVKFWPLVVADFQQAVLDPEGVAEVVSEVMLRELDRPVGEIAAVEQLKPLADILGPLLRRCAGLMEHHPGENYYERKATHPGPLFRARAGLYSGCGHARSRADHKWK